MTVVYLDELKTEEDVSAILCDLQNVVIEAVCATRNKARLITHAQMQVKQVIKKCAVNRWQNAKKDLDRMFKSLESAAMEVEQNMWQL